MSTTHNGCEEVRQERDDLRAMLIEARRDDIATLTAAAAYLKEHGRDFARLNGDAITDPIGQSAWLEATAEHLARTGVYPNGHAALELARRALAASQARENPDHEVGWWESVWSALICRDPKALCGESLAADPPEQYTLCPGCSAR